MKKFYNSIPLLIQGKISDSISNRFHVASVRKLYLDDIGSHKYENVGLSLDAEGNLHLVEVLPDELIGRHSKKNVLGYTEVLKDEPKIYKTFNLGDRPYFGDWSKGSFTLYAKRKVYKRIEHPPKNYTLTSQLLEEGEDAIGKYFIIKMMIKHTFDASSNNFEKDLLHGINVLHESYHNVDVFEESASNIDYISSVSVDWEIFPPGTRDSDIVKIIGNRRALSTDQQTEFSERYDFLRSLNPIRFVKGLGGSSSYFGAIISEDLVIFENIKYGNAIYVLYENWQDVSKLSRTEIISGSYSHLRIVHNVNWKDSLRNAIINRPAA